MKRRSQEDPQYSAAEADFIPDFIGRQCANCIYYVAENLLCKLAPDLPEVSPNAYCDGYYPIDVQTKVRGERMLSRFYKDIVKDAPYREQEAVEALKFYENIKGVNCSSCYYQDDLDDSKCHLVSTKISSYCCCSFWNVGKEQDFVGLMESRSGLNHGGVGDIYDQSLFETSEIELGTGNSPSSKDVKPRDDFPEEEEVEMEETELAGRLRNISFRLVAEENWEAAYRVGFETGKKYATQQKKSFGLEDLRHPTLTAESIANSISAPPEYRKLSEYFNEGLYEGALEVIQEMADTSEELAIEDMMTSVNEELERGGL